MKRLTKEQEASLEEVIETFKRESFTKKAEQTRNEIREALKQLIMCLCWLQQVGKTQLANDITYFICWFSDYYANGDKEMLQEMLDFYNKDCQQGQRPLDFDKGKALIIDTEAGKQFALLAKMRFTKNEEA